MRNMPVHRKTYYTWYTPAFFSVVWRANKTYCQPQSDPLSVFFCLYFLNPIVRWNNLNFRIMKSQNVRARYQNHLYAKQLFGPSAPMCQLPVGHIFVPLDFKSLTMPQKLNAKTER